MADYSVVCLTISNCEGALSLHDSHARWPVSWYNIFNVLCSADHQLHICGADSAPTFVVRIDQLPWLALRQRRPVVAAYTSALLGDDVTVHVTLLVLDDVINDARRQPLKRYWHHISRVSTTSACLKGGPKNWHIFVRLNFMRLNLYQILTNFQTYFTLWISRTFVNNTVTKHPTTPQVYRYTTLWNVSVLKATIETRGLL